MAVKIFDGRKLAKKILGKIKKEIRRLNLKLGLAVIQIGRNPISQLYINQKRKVAEDLAVSFRQYQFRKEIDILRLKKEIAKITSDPDNSGIVIQLPLPKDFESQEILNLIPAQKDVDCLSEMSLGRLYTGSLSILPPVVAGISHLFKDYKIKLKGKNVVLIGAGRLVGKPLIFWLLREGATISVLNQWSKNISYFTKKADILISGVGKPNFIKGKMVKKGVMVVDAGISIEKGRLKGDVDFPSVAKKASYITPVPGGVGPLTIASLFENLLILNKKTSQNKMEVVSNDLTR